MSKLNLTKQSLVSGMSLFQLLLKVCLYTAAKFSHYYIVITKYNSSVYCHELMFNVFIIEVMILSQNVFICSANVKMQYSAIVVLNCNMLYFLL